MQNISFFKGAIDAGGCVSNAWNLVKENYWPYFGGCLVAYLIITCVPCLNFFMAGPIMGGIYFLFLRGMQGEPVDFSMAFKGFEKFVPLMVVGLIQFLPNIIFTVLQYSIDFSQVILQNSGNGNASADAIVGALGIVSLILVFVSFIFSIAWWISFWFVVPIVMENDIDVTDAIKLSIKAGWSNFGGLLLLAIISGLLGILGVVALCIGLLFVMPIIYGASAFAYRQVFPLADQPFHQDIPPTPDAYGTFGRL